MMTDDLLFQKAFKAIIGVEGGLSTRSNDPGNWTGNKIGVGKLVGTKYGIAAGSHPNVDIVNLTLAQAEQIYYDEYWLKAYCQLFIGLLSPLGLMLFDFGVNSGPVTAVRYLQAAAGAGVDGVIGTKTTDAVKLKTVSKTLAEFSAQRLIYMMSLENWKTESLGWTRRVMTIQIACTAFTLDSPPAPVVQTGSSITITNGEVTLSAIEHIVLDALSNYAVTTKGQI